MCLTSITGGKFVKFGAKLGKLPAKFGKKTGKKIAIFSKKGGKTAAKNFKPGSTSKFFKKLVPGSLIPV